MKNWQRMSREVHSDLRMLERMGTDNGMRVNLAGMDGASYFTSAGGIVYDSGEPVASLPGAAGGAVMTGPALTASELAQIASGNNPLPTVQQLNNQPGGGASTAIPTQANNAAGLQALNSLTTAALSNLSKLPGQAGLQPGQTLTVGPGGTYQITAAGVAPGSSLGVNTGLTGSLPLLLLVGLGAVVLMGRK